MGNNEALPRMQRHRIKVVQPHQFIHRISDIATPSGVMLAAYLHKVSPGCTVYTTTAVESGADCALPGAMNPKRHQARPAAMIAMAIRFATFPIFAAPFTTPLLFEQLFYGTLVPSMAHMFDKRKHTSNRCLILSAFRVMLLRNYERSPS